MQFHRLGHVCVKNTRSGRGKRKGQKSEIPEESNSGEFKDFSLPTDYFEDVLQEDGQIISAGSKQNSGKKRKKPHSDHPHGVIQCKFCPEVFVSDWHLGRHCGKYHKDARRFECEVCGMAFTANSHLRQHIRIHSGDKPYLCEECGKDFAQHSSLAVHARTHSEERPFACDICGKSFRANSNLLQHIKIVHVGQKRNPCEVCNKSFGSIGKLKDHVKSADHKRRAGTLPKKAGRKGRKAP